MSGKKLGAALVLLAAIAALDVWPPTTAAAASRRSAVPSQRTGASLGARVDAALRDRGLKGAGLGVLVADLATGEVLYAREPDVPRVPASLTKLATSAAVLATLDGDYRFRTTLYAAGRQEGDRYKGDLHLKAWGDPMLVEERLWVLVDQLRRRGIRGIEGGLLVDDSYFDQERFGPDRAPSRAAYRAPNGAVSVNFNTTSVRGQTWAIAGDPSTNAGLELVRMLEREGVSFAGQVAAGVPVPAGAVVLAETDSKPLFAIVADLNKVSNNFIAEQLLKTIGAERHGPPGTAENGLKVVSEYLTAIGVEPSGFRLHDGSGLSPSNRLSPRALVQVLSETVRDFRIGPEFLSSLRVAGAEGSPGRFKDPLCRRKMRVKTGHLDGVSALAGFGESAGGRRLVFAILVNDYQRGRRAADRAIERVCEAFLGADAGGPFAAAAAEPFPAPDTGRREGD